MSDEDLFDVFLEPDDPLLPTTKSEACPALCVDSEKNEPLERNPPADINDREASTMKNESSADGPFSLRSSSSPLIVTAGTGCTSSDFHPGSNLDGALSCTPPPPLSTLVSPLVCPPFVSSHSESERSNLLEDVPPPSPWEHFPSSVSPAAPPSSFALRSSSSLTLPTGRALRPDASRADIVLASSNSTGSSDAGVTVIHSLAPASRLSALSAVMEEGDGDGMGVVTRSTEAAVDPKEVRRETYSGIAVRRVTRRFLQLAVTAAESPFISFQSIHRAFAHSGRERGTSPAPATLERLCIGVVCRKSDPKKSNKAGGTPYAVVTLWNMDKTGISPSSETEVAFLLCGLAFQRTYSQLCLGQVLAIDHLALVSSGSSSSLPPSEIPTSRGSFSSSPDPSASRLSFLLRLENPENIRLLGTADEFTSCASTVRGTGEQCRNVVHKGVSAFCKYHLQQQVKSKTNTGDKSGSVRARSGAALTVLSGSSHRRIGPCVGKALPPSASSFLGSSTRPAALPTAATRATAAVVARRQLPSVLPVPFLTVSGGSGMLSNSYGDGSKVSGRSDWKSLYPSHSAASSLLLGGSDGVYSAIKGAQGLPISEKIICSVPTSSSSLSVKSRGMATLIAAKEEELAKERMDLLRRAKKESLNGTSGSDGSAASTVRPPFAVHGSSSDLASRKRLRDGVWTEENNTHTVAATTPPPSMTHPETNLSHAIGEIQAQFAPISRTAASKSFHALSITAEQLGGVHGGRSRTTLPLSSTSDQRFRSTAGKGKMHSSNTPLRECNEKVSSASTLLRVVAKDIARHHRDASVLASRLQPTNATEPGRSATSTAAPSSSLLVQIAASVDTSQHELISESEKAEMTKTLTRLSAKETALMALEKITKEENISAQYCHECKLYLPRVPDSCKLAKHHLERRNTTKHYICCGHCGLKTFVLGDNLFHAMRLFPSCPRCAVSAKWEQGNAAPEWKNERRRYGEDSSISDI